jgi:hypothetical protein
MNKVKIIRLFRKLFKFKGSRIVKLKKIQMSKDELLSIPEKELELFIQLTNFYNDVNILQKLMVISGISREKANNNKILEMSLSSQALFFMRIQAGKLYEGWNMLGEHFFNNRVFSLEYNKNGSSEGKKALSNIKNYFGGNNFIKQIRNKYAFHYSKESSEEMVKQITNAPESEIFEIFLSEEVGNCFYSIAHDLLNTSILEEIDSNDWATAMDRFFQEIIDATKRFLDFTQDCILVISKKYLQMNYEEVQIPEPSSLKDITLPFFVKR